MFKLQEGDKIGIITPSNFLDYQTPLDPELKASLAHNRGINPRDAADLAVEYLKIQTHGRHAAEPCRRLQ